MGTSTGGNQPSTSNPPRQPRQPTPPRNTPSRTPSPSPPGTPGAATQGNMAANIKYPKPDRFYGDPGSYRPWIASVKLYFDSTGTNNARNQKDYALGLMAGSASLWVQDYIATHPRNAAQQHTWAEFENALEQAFAPAQENYIAEQQLRSLRQRGRYIEEYISEFSVLASRAGLTTDNVALRAYFQEGLDPAIAYEALRSNPTTLADWKTAARNAYRIITDQERYKRTLRPSSYKKKSNKGRKGNRYNGYPTPRYVDINTQPISPQFRRNQWDMDIDATQYRSINELAETSDSEEFNEQEDTDSDEEIDTTVSGRRIDAIARAIDKWTLNYLTDEQRTALRNGECFFCHKKGHFFRTCPARKAYLNQKGKTSMAKKTKPFKSGPKGKGKGTRKGSKSKPVDPNAMVYNMENDSDDESDPDGNF